MNHGRPSGSKVSGEVRAWLVAGLGLGCFVAGAWVVHGRRASVAHAAPVVMPPASEAAAPSGPTELPLVYSTELTAWLRDAVADFQRTHPEVRVRLQGMGTVDAVRAIVDGRVRPALWAPADGVSADLLDRAWREAHGGSIVAREEGWPKPLALTPMVFVVWESRARALVGDGATLSWTRLGAVARSTRGWAGVGGNPAWGSLRFGHTDPSRSHAGLQTLVLMAHGWRGGAARLDAAALGGEGFVGYMRALEAHDPAGDRGTGSSGEFAQTIALQGPGRYDVAMVYESQAIASFEVARGRWGESLRVYYPPVNAWADHPLCLLDGANLTPAQREGARQLAAHLLGASAQAAAVRHGFRPADPAVPVVTADADNPFVKYRDQGVRVALTQVAPPPSLDAVDAALAAWRRATGR